MKDECKFIPNATNALNTKNSDPEMIPMQILNDMSDLDDSILRNGKYIKLLRKKRLVHYSKDDRKIKKIFTAKRRPDILHHLCQLYKGKIAKSNCINEMIKQ
jgi:hypothetical protein